MAINVFSHGKNFEIGNDAVNQIGEKYIQHVPLSGFEPWTWAVFDLN